MGFIVKKVAVSFRLFVIETQASVRCLEIIPSLEEKSTKLNNKKLLTCSILSFSTFKLLLFFHRAKHWTTFGPLFFAKRPKGVISSSSIYYYHFFVIFSSTEFQPFFMHNKYVLIFLLAFNLVSFFPLYLKRSVADTSKFSVLQKKKMYKTKLTK